MSKGRKFRLAIMREQDARVWDTLPDPTDDDALINGSSASGVGGGTKKSMCLTFSDICYWPDATELGPAGGM